MLLTTGANGNLGRSVIANLRTLLPSTPFAVATRDPASSFALELATKGIEVRKANFDSPETLPAAFAGIEKALIISTYSENSTRLRQNLNALEAAKTAGVRHIVYTSFVGAGGTSLAEHNQLVHSPTEQAIIASGLRYTILRHALYADLLIHDIAETLATRKLHRCGGDTACAYIARSDLGESAAKVLVNEGHENRIYTETMAKALRGEDIALSLSEAFGEEISYQSVPARDWPSYMTRHWGVPEMLAQSSIGTMLALESGEFNRVTTDYKTITGHNPRTLEQMLQQMSPVPKA